MKLSYNWLKEFIKVKFTPKELAEKLTLAGFEVGKIDKVLELDDPIFDLEITPNRGDCLSVLGLAREVATIMRINMRIFANRFANSVATGSFVGLTSTSDLPQDDSLKVEVKEPALCPKYTARIIKNIKVEESPEWLKARLRACGIRSINNIVDITNYAMIELGQPMHAFDCGQMSDVRCQMSDVRCQMSDKEIIVRRAKHGEKIVTIDEKEQELDESMLVIADSKRPIAIAGIMGGKNTEVTEKTKDIILESAQFDPISIRKTARKLGLQSESSYRFERGVDWNGIEWALDRATEMIIQNAKYKKKGVQPVAKRRAAIRLGVGQKAIVQQQERYLRRVVKLPVEKISELLGIKINKKRIKEILESLGFKIAEYSLSSWSLAPFALRIDQSNSLKKSYLSLSNFQFPQQKVRGDRIPWLRKKIIEEAKKLLGRPYKYGAKESEAPKKFDCSSFVQYLYKKIGIIIPRCSIDQVEIGYEITKKYENTKSTKLRKVLKPGDLVFGKGEDIEPLPHYSANYPNGLGHVGIYAGAGRVIHVDRKKKGVIEESLEEFIRRKEWRGARRIICHPERSEGSRRVRRGPQDDILIVTVPSWREDISIPEDLIEEIGRVYDYNKLKPTALRGETPSPKINKELYWENLIKDTLAAAGMTEVYNYSFYGRTQMNTDGNTDLHRGHLRVVNPINPDQEFLRMSLIPQLLEVIEKNAKNFDEIKIFEIGKVYFANLHEFTTNFTNELPDERKMIGGICQMSNVKCQMYLKIKGVIELLFEKLGIEKDKISYKSLADVHEKNLQATSYKLQATKSAVIMINKEMIGVVGETNSNTGAFELDFQKLIKHAQEEKKFQTISYYPAVERDLAIVLDKNIPYIDLEKTIKDIDPLIKEIELFDIFENERKIGRNKKSLAFHLKFQALNRTLRKEEVDKIFRNILEKIEKDFGAKIRE